MKTTIDKAGRVVIPAVIRRRAGLRAGTEIEVSLDDDGVRIRRAAPGMKLVRERGHLMARPTAPEDSLPQIDLATLVEEERSRWPW